MRSKALHPGEAGGWEQSSEAKAETFDGSKCAWREAPEVTKFQSGGFAGYSPGKMGS